MKKFVWIIPAVLVIALVLCVGVFMLRLDTPMVKAENDLDGINITWESVEDASEYIVFGREGPESEWDELGTTTETSFFDKNVTPGIYYVYSVRAVNNNRESKYDRDKCVTIQRVLAPQAKAVNISEGIYVTWEEVVGATKYVVNVREGTESDWEKVCTTTGTSFVDVNVNNGIYYVYSIRAINGTGHSKYDRAKTCTIKRVGAGSTNVGVTEFVISTLPQVTAVTETATTNAYIISGDNFPEVVMTSPPPQNTTTKPTTTKPTTTKPVSSSSSNGSYNDEIAKENQRHKDAISSIESEYDGGIEFCKENISYLRAKCGYSSSSSYSSSISSLQASVVNKEKKLAMMKMDTSGAYRAEIARLERELENDYRKLEELNTNYYLAVEAEGYESQLRSLESSKSSEMAQENQKHQDNISRINTKYGK